MKKLMIALCAAAMAAPLSFTAAPVLAQDIRVQFGSPGYQGPRYHSRHYDGPRRHYDGPRRGFYRDGRYGYYNGHRGYTTRRPGYRYHEGFWFPAAAFAAIAGAAIAAQAAPPVRTRYVNAHEEWCANRYRTYRASDNTYKPTVNSRAQCISPYS